MEMSCKICNWWYVAVHTTFKSQVHSGSAEYYCCWTSRAGDVVKNSKAVLEMGEIWSTCIMAPLCGCRCSAAAPPLTLCTQNSPPRQKGVPNLCVQLCTVVSKLFRKLNRIRYKLTKIWFSIILEKNLVRYQKNRATSLPEKMQYVLPLKKL